MPGPGLGREVRVGDLPPDHADQVTLPVGQRLLGLLRAGDPAGAQHRDVHRGADRGRDVQSVPRGGPHARHHRVQAGGGHSRRGADVVHPAAAAGHPGHLDRLAERGAVLDHLVAAEPDAERAAGADRLAYRGHDLQQQPGPVAQRSAVAVRALVRGPGQEPPDDRGLRALQLDPVEPALRTVPGDAGVAGHDRGDLVRPGRRGHLAEQRVRDRARRLYREPGVHPGGLAAVVVQLGQHRNPVRVHGRGDPPVAGDHLGPVALDQLLVGLVRRVSRMLLGDDQPGPAGRAPRVVRGVLLGGQPVAGVVGQVGGEHHPVGQRERAHPQRAEQVPVRGPRARRPVPLAPCSSAQLREDRAQRGCHVGVGPDAPQPPAAQPGQVPGQLLVLLARHVEQHVQPR